MNTATDFTTSTQREVSLAAGVAGSVFVANPWGDQGVGVPVYIKFLSDGALTADDTNYATLTATTAAGVDVGVITTETSASGGTGNIARHQE